MRNAFINTLISLAEADSRVALLMAEVGFSVVEPFEQRFPKRFFNVGIAEQDLVTAVAGMAIAGMRPVAYSMSCFLPTRAFEQIKTAVCYQNLPVTLVGVGSGLSYGEMGETHHAAEESAIMRSLPNMRVVFPSDAFEVAEAIKDCVSGDGPAYIGFPKAPSPEIPPHAFIPGKAVRYRDGGDGAILAVGYMTGTALKAAEIMDKKGVRLTVYGVHTVKPLDTDAVFEAVKNENIFVLDEHYTLAGIGNEIAGIILKSGASVKRFVDLSLPDSFPGRVMRHNTLLDFYGLTPDRVAERIARAYGL